MIKLLHSADWHLDTPMTGHDDATAAFLKQELQKVPEKIAALCKAENCQLLLLSGDLFDGAYTKESFALVYKTLAELKIPVFISPGNHDYCRPGSVYLEESWPENVHIFRHATIESVTLPELDCKLYGAGFESMDCPGLLEGFSAEGDQRWHIGVFHGDPASATSAYCPITAQQLRQCGLDYLALGHIHKGETIRSGEVLCAWPGCPMGRAFDECGEKGALVVTLDEGVHARFLPLDTPRFFDLETEVGEDPAAAVAALLPVARTDDFYRITLTGYASDIDTDAICQSNTHVRSLILRDQTLPEMDLWSAVGEDSLEGTFFRMLHDSLDSSSEAYQKSVKLAARISRQILDGQEVKLP